MCGLGDWYMVYGDTDNICGPYASEEEAKDAACDALKDEGEDTEKVIILHVKKRLQLNRRIEVTEQT